MSEYGFWPLKFVKNRDFDRCVGPEKMDFEWRIQGLSLPGAYEKVRWFSSFSVLKICQKSQLRPIKTQKIVIFDQFG